MDDAGIVDGLNGAWIHGWMDKAQMRLVQNTSSAIDPFQSSELWDTEGQKSSIPSL